MHTDVEFDVTDFVPSPFVPTDAVKLPPKMGLGGMFEMVGSVGAPGPTLKAWAVPLAAREVDARCHMGGQRARPNSDEGDSHAIARHSAHRVRIGCDRLRPVAVRAVPLRRSCRRRQRDGIMWRRGRRCREGLGRPSAAPCRSRTWAVSQESTARNRRWPRPPQCTPGSCWTHRSPRPRVPVRRSCRRRQGGRESSAVSPRTGRSRNEGRHSPRGKGGRPMKAVGHFLILIGPLLPPARTSPIWTRQETCPSHTPMTRWATIANPLDATPVGPAGKSHRLRRYGGPEGAGH